MSIIIVGNSAASTGAIEAIRKYDRSCSIIQFSDETYPLYSRCLTSYHISGKVDDKKILYRNASFHKEMQVDLHTGTRIIGVDPVNQQLTCENLKTYHYEKLLIATGSSPKIPDNIKKDIKGIFVLRTIENAVAICKECHSSGWRTNRYEDSRGFKHLRIKSYGYNTFKQSIIPNGGFAGGSDYSKKAGRK